MAFVGDKGTRFNNHFLEQGSLSVSDKAIKITIGGKSRLFSGSAFVGDKVKVITYNGRRHIISSGVRVLDWYKRSGYGDYIWEIAECNGHLFVVKRSATSENLEVLSVKVFSKSEAELAALQGYYFSACDTQAFIYRPITTTRHEFTSFDTNTGELGGSWTELTSYWAQGTCTDNPAYPPFVNDDTNIYAQTCYWAPGALHAVGTFSQVTGYAGSDPTPGICAYGHTTYFSASTFGLAGGKIYLYNIYAGATSYVLPPGSGSKQDVTHYPWQPLYGGTLDGSKLWGMLSTGEVKYRKADDTLSDAVTIDTY